MQNYQNVTIFNHPLIKHKVSHLCDVNTGSKEFSELVTELAMLMGYEALRDLPTEYVEVKTPITTVPDFSGKSLTEVMKWASKNDITMTQEYEYSDMIDEYHVIAQDVKAGSLIKNTKSITLSIGEGPNPNKMVAIPSMVGWTSEQVLDFILSL